MTRARPIAAGNWKMHGTGADLDRIRAIAAAAKGLAGVETIVCLPATLIDRARAAGIALGGQDCHTQSAGAYTGDISAPMLRDAGADYVIVGHSERRADGGDDDATVAAKAHAAWKSGLIAIICIGETFEEYRSGATIEVLRRQIAASVPVEATAYNTLVAYEPVWAIGSGLTPEYSEIQDAHAAIRADLAARLAGGDRVSLLYGGSVKPANAEAIFALPDVDGGLVGGASLSPDEFVPIIEALAREKGEHG